MMRRLLMIDPLTRRLMAGLIAARFHGSPAIRTTQPPSADWWPSLRRFATAPHDVSIRGHLEIAPIFCLEGSEDAVEPRDECLPLVPHGKAGSVHRNIGEPEERIA